MTASGAMANASTMPMTKTTPRVIFLLCMGHALGECKRPNDLKLSDSGPEAGAVSTAAQGEGAGCAWASWQAAQPVTEPVGPKPPPLIETDMTAVRCSAWLGVSGFIETNQYE